MPHAPALVLLHGIGGHGLVWEPVARVLATRYRCIAPDARGHGESGWAGPEGYVADLHFADLAVFLDALGIEEAALCGHSMGAATAIQLAACRPERCRAVAVVDAYPDPEPSGGSDRIARFYASLPERFASPEAAIAESRRGARSARTAIARPGVAAARRRRVHVAAGPSDSRRVPPMAGGRRAAPPRRSVALLERHLGAGAAGARRGEQRAHGGDGPADAGRATGGPLLGAARRSRAPRRAAPGARRGAAVVSRKRLTGRVVAPPGGAIASDSEASIC